MKDFEEMEVWRDAQDLAVDVYNDYSKVKDYSFCDQIKRRRPFKTARARRAPRFRRS